MKMSRLLCAACLVLFGGFWSVSDAQRGHDDSYRGLQGTCLEADGTCNQRDQWQSASGIAIDEMTANTPLTSEEELSLIYMREEEKLARDLYATFYENWGTPVFANILMSEQQHMDSVLNLMEAYEIADSATTTAGEFNDAALQDLYDSLITRGSASQAEALYSAAFVEETDISDLQAILETTTNEAVIKVYGNLLAASEKHLRHFVDNIECLGFIYTAQVLEQDQVTEILNGDSEHGNIAVGGNGRVQAVDTEFQSDLSTDSGKRGNRIAVTQQERLQIRMLVEPDQQHQGQSAEFVTYAVYTPEGAEDALMFMLNAQNAWQAWDGDFGHLVATKVMNQLRAQNRFTIYDGLLQAPGSFQIYTAYRLRQDGTLVICGDPIEFTVE
jgi:hypothetical protein